MSTSVANTNAVGRGMVLSQLLCVACRFCRSLCHPCCSCLAETVDATKCFYCCCYCCCRCCCSLQVVACPHEPPPLPARQPASLQACLPGFAVVIITITSYLLAALSTCGSLNPKRGSEVASFNTAVEATEKDLNVPPGGRTRGLC